MAPLGDAPQRATATTTEGKVDELHRLLLGNGNPEKGLIWRINSRLFDIETRVANAEYRIRLAFGAAAGIGAVLGTIIAGAAILIIERMI